MKLSQLTTLKITNYDINWWNWEAHDFLVNCTAYIGCDRGSLISIYYLFTIKLHMLIIVLAFLCANFDLLLGVRWKRWVCTRNPLYLFIHHCIINSFTPAQIKICNGSDLGILSCLVDEDAYCLFIHQCIINSFTPTQITICNGSDLGIYSCLVDGDAFSCTTALWSKPLGIWN